MTRTVFILILSDNFDIKGCNGFVILISSLIKMKCSVMHPQVKKNGALLTTFIFFPSMVVNGVKELLQAFFQIASLCSTLERNSYRFGTTTE